MKRPQILPIPLVSLVVLAGFAIGLAACSKHSTGNNPNPGGNQAPTIASIRPTHGPGAAKDTITGAGFDVNNSSIFFNGQKATLVSATSTQLVVTVPALAGTGKVTVTAGSNTVTGPVFTYDTVWNPNPFADHLTDPRHLALDSSGNVYVTYASTVGKITADGTLTNFSSIGLVKPIGVAADANGNIFVADADIPNARYKIYKYSAPSVRDSFSISKDFVFSLTLDHSGNLYAVTLDAVSLSDVTKFSPGGIATPLATHVGNSSGFSTGMTIDAASTMYLTSSVSAVNSQSFYTVSPSGVVGGYPVSSAAHATDVAWSNGYLYFSSVTDGAVYRANPAGQVSVVAQGLVNPYAVLVDKKGNVYVASEYMASSADGKITKYSYQ